MEAAYVNKAKALASAKAHQKATDQIVSHLQLQLGTETSKRQKLEEERKRQQAKYDTTFVNYRKAEDNVKWLKMENVVLTR